MWRMTAKRVRHPWSLYGPKILCSLSAFSRIADDGRKPMRSQSILHRTHQAVIVKSLTVVSVAPCLTICALSQQTQRAGTLSASDYPEIREMIAKYAIPV